MITGKYIIFERNGLQFPILFPNHFVNHYEMDDKKGKAVSAGFFSIDGEDVYTSGESISLKLKSRPVEDSAIIKNQFN